jgi:FMN phosphatase YigB (HAD superfamily)
MTECVIFDVDGTLIDVNPIRDYVTGRTKNFDVFHKASLFCAPNHDVLNALKCFNVIGCPVIIVTARSREYERVTKDWLEKHEAMYAALYMREVGDFRPDYEAKSDILAQMRGDGWEPVAAWDDNPNVIKLWEENNIKTIVVPGYIDSKQEESA